MTPLSALMVGVTTSIEQESAQWPQNCLALQCLPTKARSTLPTLSRQKTSTNTSWIGIWQVTRVQIWSSKKSNRNTTLRTVFQKYLSTLNWTITLVRTGVTSLPMEFAAPLPTTGVFCLTSGRHFNQSRAL